MLIIFCNTCGKRIPAAELEQLGVRAGDETDQLACVTCRPADRPVSGVIPQTSKTEPIARPISGSTRRTSAQAAVLTRSSRTGLAPARASGAGGGGGGERRAEASKIPLLVLGAGGVLVLVGLVVAFSGGGSKPVAKAPDGAHASDSKSSSGKVLDLQKPAVPAPAPKAAPGGGALPAREKPVEAPNVPGFMKPVTTEELGLTKRPASTPTPAEAAPAAPAPVAPAATERPAQTGLMELTDVAELRTRLLAIPNVAQKERAAIKRLCELPPPSMAEQVVFSQTFTGKDIPGSWHDDYGSKLQLSSEQGEAALKVFGSKERQASYVVLRDRNVVCNRTRVRLRIWQEGVKRLRFSIQTALLVRFNMDFPAPAAGAWQDVEVPIHDMKSGEFKLENFPFSHIELHGFPSGAPAAAVYYLAKFELVNGGE